MSLQRPAAQGPPVLLRPDPCGAQNGRRRPAVAGCL